MILFVSLCSFLMHLGIFIKMYAFIRPWIFSHRSPLGRIVPVSLAITIFLGLLASPFNDYFLNWNTDSIAAIAEARSNIPHLLSLTWLISEGYWGKRRVHHAPSYFESLGVASRIPEFNHLCAKVEVWPYPYIQHSQDRTSSSVPSWIIPS